MCLRIVIKIGGLQRDTNVSCFVLMMLEQRAMWCLRNGGPGMRAWLTGVGGLRDCEGRSHINIAWDSLYCQYYALLVFIRMVGVGFSNTECEEGTEKKRLREGMVG